MIDSKRVRTLKEGKFTGHSVLYWMNRDKRVDDNWALIMAQSLALKKHVPLIVCFQYVGKFSEANIRQYGFLFKGLEGVKIKLDKLNIEFVLIQDTARNALPRIIHKRSVGSLIVDYNPLKVYQKRLNNVLKNIDVPVYQVDAHNIIPVWVTSQKKEYAAYTIRRKIQSNLDHFLTDYPKLKIHPYGTVNSKGRPYDNIIDDLCLDHQ